MKLETKVTGAALGNPSMHPYTSKEVECIECGKKFSSSHWNNKPDTVYHIAVYDKDKKPRERQIYRDNDYYCRDCAEKNKDSRQAQKAIQKYRKQQVAEEL